jgi:hypothetical protein
MELALGFKGLISLMDEKVRSSALSQNPMPTSIQQSALSECDRLCPLLNSTPESSSDF